MPVFHFSLLTYDNLHYSVLKLFTGFVVAAFIAWMLTVIIAMAIIINAAIANIHQLKLIR